MAIFTPYRKQKDSNVIGACNLKVLNTFENFIFLKNSFDRGADGETRELAKLKPQNKSAQLNLGIRISHSIST